LDGAPLPSNATTAAGSVVLAEIVMLITPLVRSGIDCGKRSAYCGVGSSGGSGSCSHSDLSLQVGNHQSEHRKNRSDKSKWF